MRACACAVQLKPTCGGEARKPLPGHRIRYRPPCRGRVIIITCCPLLLCVKLLVSDVYCSRHASGFRIRSRA